MMKCGLRRTLPPVTCVCFCPPLGVLWPMLLRSLASSPIPDFFLSFFLSPSAEHATSKTGKARSSRETVACVDMGGRARQPLGRHLPYTWSVTAPATSRSTGTLEAPEAMQRHTSTDGLSEIARFCGTWPFRHTSGMCVRLDERVIHAQEQSTAGLCSVARTLARLPALTGSLGQVLVLVHRHGIRNGLLGLAGAIDLVHLHLLVLVLLVVLKEPPASCRLCRLAWQHVLVTSAARCRALQ